MANNLKIIARALRQQAESGRPAGRQLPGGLSVKFSQDGPVHWLDLARKIPGPGSQERKQWRAAFEIPENALEYKAVEGEYVIWSMEWKE